MPDMEVALYEVDATGGNCQFLYDIVVPAEDTEVRLDEIREYIEKVKLLDYEVQCQNIGRNLYNKQRRRISAPKRVLSQFVPKSIYHISLCVTISVYYRISRVGIGKPSSHRVRRESRLSLSLTAMNNLAKCEWDIHTPTLSSGYCFPFVNHTLYFETW